MAGLCPRVVVVTRPTWYELALATHGTQGHAAFVLRQRGEDLAALRKDHDRFLAVLHSVLAAIPLNWRQVRVTRAELDRFLFEPQDVVVVVGQDGLVANVARYLEGQPVIGFNPAPQRNAGVLVTYAPEQAETLIRAVGEGRATMEPRAMVEVSLDDGQSLRGLNDVFIGHRSHQSARYRLQAGSVEEAQSSSGIVVCTGTGATGWAASIVRNRRCEVRLPAPDEPALAWFVREAWPGPNLGVSLAEGTLHGEHQPLCIVSEMDAGGVIFSDGIEADALVFDRGRRAQVRVAPVRLLLA